MPDFDDVDAILAVVNGHPDEVAAPGAGHGRRHVHLGLRQGPAAGAREAVRAGEDRAVERDDRPRLVDRRRSRAHRDGARRPRRAHEVRAPADGREGLAGRALGRAGVPALRGGEPRAPCQPVPPRRAGCAAVHGADRGDGAVDRREVLRVDAGDGRGAPRGGVRPLPRREARDAVPDERAPRRAHRRHPRRLPLGHHVPRHADHGGGARARRVRIDVPDVDRAAAPAAAALRDVGRGTPRRVRCASACRRPTPTSPVPSCASARSSCSRPRCACATGSCTRRCGSGSASRRGRSCPYFVRQQTEEDVLFQRMLFAKIVPNCKKLGLLDGRDGWLRDRFTELGVIEFEDHVDTDTSTSPERVQVRASA